MSPTLPDPTVKIGDRIGVFAAIALLAVGLHFGVPAYLEWTAPDAVQEALASAHNTGGCAAPTEHEQLHIVITQRGEKLAAECMYVGTRGTYNRPR